MGELLRATALGRLLSALGGHQALLVTVLAIALITAAVLAVTLVALTPSEDRVDAIYAVAEVLRALLPWPGWRRDPRGRAARRQGVGRGPWHEGRPGPPRHAVRSRGPARRVPP